MPIRRTLAIAGFASSVVLGCATVPTMAGSIDGRRLTLGVDSLIVDLIRDGDMTAAGLRD